MTDFDASAHLKSLETLPDTEIDLAISALSLSSSVQGRSLEKYIHHLEMLEQGVAARYRAIIDNGGAEDVRSKLAALKHILSDEHDYSLDTAESEPLETGDLARVIERRKGLSIALSVLYVTVARRQGWSADVISFPNYTLCRLDHQGERLIFDAPRQCKLMAAPDLRAMLKKAVGPHAELSAAYFEPPTNRQILVQLQNQIKLRLIEMSDYGKALSIVEQMRAIDPAEYRLFLDAGVLYAKVNKPQPAIRALESYVQRAPNGRDRQEALQLLQELKSGLVV